MVQEFHVLKCYSCRTFQVHQVKKANKWTCKMCGEKQSLLKEFGRGTGVDCRCHVQKLNAKRAEMEQGTCLLRENDEEAGLCRRGGAQNAGSPDDKQRDAELAEKSRWDKYLLHTPQEGEELGEEPEDNDYLSISNHRGNRNSRKRKRVVGRPDDRSFNKEMRQHGTEGKPPAFPVSKSSTAQHTLISIRPSSNQTRQGLPGGAIDTHHNLASSGFTRGAINTDHNQASPGFTRGTINADHNQESPGFARGTINTVHNQASPGFTRGTINTDYKRIVAGLMPTNTVELHKTKIALDRFCTVSAASSAAAPISRWTQFLPAPHPQGEEEEEEEEEEDVGEVVNHSVNNMKNDTLGLAGSSATPYSDANICELGRVSELPKLASSHSQHPPPHQPGPLLPFHSLFNTSDDLDSFDLDDVF